MKHDNVYAQNAVTGATANPVMPNPDEIDEEFIKEANRVLLDAAETARFLVGAHQSAIAIIVDKDFSSIRKIFSLSNKYERWKNYDAPAQGYGTHAWLLDQQKTVRFTQEELEKHPAWQNFGTESDAHPPMRGWLATPIVDQNNKNWGLIQLSDKYEGEFDEEDEAQFIKYTRLVSTALEALWNVRNLKKAVKE